MGPQSPILHCHGTTVTNTPLPWDHSRQYSIAIGPQSSILHCHGTSHQYSIAMGPQSPILHCHGITVTNTPLPWDHSHQYSIAMRPQSPILHCHRTTVSISKQQTQIVPGGELGVARLTELEDVGGKAECPEGSKQLRVDLFATHSCDTSTYLS